MITSFWMVAAGFRRDRDALGRQIVRATQVRKVVTGSHEQQLFDVLSGDDAILVIDEQVLLPQGYQGGAGEVRRRQCWQQFLFWLEQ